jgi:8-oxo-dGTP diphosphatase
MSAVNSGNDASGNDNAKTGEKNLKMVLVVAAALIDSEGRVLLAQRPLGKVMAGLWEFPGGKVEGGETPEAALARELREELGLTVETADLKPLTFASHTYPTFHLLMPLFACYKWQGDPAPLEGQQLAWASCDELHAYDMPAADVPLIGAILS